MAAAEPHVREKLQRLVTQVTTDGGSGWDEARHFIEQVHTDEGFQTVMADVTRRDVPTRGEALSEYTQAYGTLLGSLIEHFQADDPEWRQDADGLRPLLFTYPTAHVHRLAPWAELDKMCLAAVMNFTTRYLNLLAVVADNEVLAVSVYNRLIADDQPRFLACDMFLTMLRSLISYTDPLDGTFEAYYLGILRVLRVVVQHSNIALAQLQEDLLSILISLMSAVVTVDIMGAVFAATAAFCQRSDIAISVWRKLEHLIPDVTAASQLQTEKELMRYPETVGSITLYRAMWPHLATAATSAHLPSFLPFLQYLTDTVLVGFHTRAYSDPEEKWVVAWNCVELQRDILQHFQPQPSPQHEVDPTTGMLVNQRTRGNLVSCGEWLMRRLLSGLQDDRLVERLLWIVTTGAASLPQKDTLVKRGAMEHCIQVALELLHFTLMKQGAYLGASVSDPSVGLLSALDDIIVQRSFHAASRPSLYAGNTVMALTTYLGYSKSLALPAAELLAGLSATQADLPKLYQAAHDVHQAVRPFVDGMEQGDPQLQAAIARVILASLVNDTAALGECSMAQLLCGMSPGRRSTATFFQIVGATPPPPNCLQVVLDRIQKADLLREDPQLAELYAEVVYRLTSHHSTCGHVIARLVEPQNDYLLKQFTVIQGSKDLLTTSPAHLVPSTTMMPNNIAAALNHRCYVLKTAAAFLHACVHHTRRHQYRTHVQLVVDRLVAKDTLWGRPGDGMQHHFLLLSLLHDVDILALVGQHVLPEVVTNPSVRHCIDESTGDMAARRINLTKLDALLEGAATDGADDVMVAAMRANGCFRLHQAVCNAVEGWSEAVQVVLTESTHLVTRLRGEFEQDLMTLLHAVLWKLRFATDIAHNGSSHQSTIRHTLHLLRPVDVRLSSVALCLITHLRHPPQDQSDGPDSVTRPCPLLDSDHLPSVAVECVTKQHTTPQFRTNMYCVLMNYLEAIHEATILRGDDMDAGITPLVDVSRDLPLLLRVADGDAFNLAEPITSPVTFALVSCFIRTLPGIIPQLTSFINRSLQHLEELDDRLRQFVEVPHDFTPDGSDRSLQGDPHLMYVYDALCGTLCAVAGVPSGAEYLLQTCRITERLAQLRSLHVVGYALEADVPATGQSVGRSSTLVIPVLRILMQLLHSVGPTEPVTEGVCRFITGHSGIIKALLKPPYADPVLLSDGLTPSTSGSSMEKDVQEDDDELSRLQEVYTTTSLFVLLARHPRLVATHFGVDMWRKFALVGILERMCRTDLWGGRDMLKTETGRAVVRNVLHIAIALRDVIPADVEGDRSVPDTPAGSAAALLHVAQQCTTECVRLCQLLAGPPPLDLHPWTLGGASVPPRGVENIALEMQVASNVSTLELVLVSLFHTPLPSRPVFGARQTGSDGSQRMVGILQVVERANHDFMKSARVASLCRRLKDLLRDPQGR